MLKQHSSARGEGRVGTVIGLLVIVTAFYLAFKFIPVYIKTYQFGEEIETLSRRAGSARDATEEDIRKKLLEEAERLDLPVRKEDIHIRLNYKRLKVEVKYAVPIEMPGYTYRLRCEHMYEGHRFRL